MTRPPFNIRIGTQTVGPRYGFTNESRLLETARGILDMGSDILKIALIPESYNIDAPRGLTPLQVASTIEDFKSVLDMPFNYIFCWAHPVGSCILGPKQEREVEWEETVYQQMYDLAVWFLTTYNKSGKTFHIGNWEGDWILLGDGQGSMDADPIKLKYLHRAFELRQQAVIDARESIQHDNVWVAHYIELNRPLDAKDKGLNRLTNSILPKLTVDLISYSAYDAQAAGRLTEALDYIESNARFTDYLDQHYERKVFVGEYDAYRDYHVSGYASPEEQVTNVMDVIKTSLKWGAPFVLFWSFYNNESERLIHGGGFWLIDDNNEKQLTWHLHHRLLSDIKDWYLCHNHGDAKRISNEAWREFIINREQITPDQYMELATPA